MKIYYVTAEVALRKKVTKLSLSPKLVERLAWSSQLFGFVKFHSPLRIWCLLCRNWPFLPPNHLAFWITLIHQSFCFGEVLGKKSTQTRSLVQNWVRFLNNVQKSAIAFNKGANQAPFFLVVNWVSSCFEPLFPFSRAPPLLLHIYILPAHMCTSTIITF